MTHPDDELLERWLETAVAHLGLELSDQFVSYSDLPRFLRSAGPAICRLPGGSDAGFLAIMGCRRQKLTLLTPDHTVQQCPLDAVRAALCHDLEAPILPEIKALLDAAAVSPSRRAHSQTQILRQRLGLTVIKNCWLLEAAPASSFWRQMRRLGVPVQVLAFITLYALQYGLLLLSWGLLGRAAFQGQIAPALLQTWVLLLLTIVPLRMLVTWLQSVVAVGVGGLLQRRLLYGVLRLHPDEIRHMGAGQLMGRTFEAEEVERLALNGGLAASMAMIELVVAGWILSVGATSFLHLSLLVG